jgi:hypothetical protein
MMVTLVPSSTQQADTKNVSAVGGGGTNMQKIIMMLFDPFSCHNDYFLVTTI